MGSSPGEEGLGLGGGFGVRRPLRFLAYKLDLDEKQIVQLARILDERKTERAQAAVDDRRTLADFADALAGEQFDSTKATAASEKRVEKGRAPRRNTDGHLDGANHCAQAPPDCTLRVIAYQMVDTTSSKAAV